MTGFAAASAASSTPVTAWPERLALTLLLLAAIGGVLWGMRRNWRKRAARQDWVELPPPPPEPQPVNESFEARYVASVTTEDWLDRVAAKGLGMPGHATVSVLGDGLIIERDGEPDVYMPRTIIEEVATARGIAQEVYERDGIVAITWRSGDRRITTGLRMASADEHVALVDAVNRLIGRAEA